MKFDVEILKWSTVTNEVWCCNIETVNYVAIFRTLW